MSASTPARPPQVTMAAWVTMLGSLFLLFSVFQVVADLRSLETRESVAAAVQDQPLAGLGFDVEQALGALHVLSVIAGACAAAAMILGWQVLQRNRTARVALTAVVVPLFLAGLVTGGFLSSMVAVSAVILWTRPARDWFDGASPASDPFRRGASRDRPPEHHPPERRPEQPGQRPPEQAPHGDPAHGRVPPEQPAPGRPAAEQHGPGAGQGPGARPVPAPYAGFGEHRPLAPRPTGARVPREVLQGCIVTWVFASIVAMSMIGVLVAFTAQPALVEEIHGSDPRIADSGVTVDMLRTAGSVLALAFLLWSLLAVVLAFLTSRGNNLARVALIVSAALAGMISLVMVLSSPPLLLLVLGCVLTIVFLTRPAANQWFERRR